MPKKKLKWYRSHAETKGGGSWWYQTRAPSKSKAASNIRKRIKSETDAKIEGLWVERKKKWMMR